VFLKVSELGNTENSIILIAGLMCANMLLAGTRNRGIDSV